MNIYMEADAKPSVLSGRKIVVAGYGNQGRPQALNLRDSGFDVEVAGRSGGGGRITAGRDGFRTFDLGEGAGRADVLLYLLPDEVQGRVFAEEIGDNLKPGATLCFAHGFAVTFGQIDTGGCDCVLVAPKGQGGEVRRSYECGSGVPCLIAVEHDRSGEALARALAIAWGLGCLRVGGFPTSFREEAVSDLFGEQVVLCGGVPALIKRAFDVLVRKGFSPEIAYFECFHELRIIVDLFERYGFSGMRDMISGTAAYGSLAFGERLIGEKEQRAMEELFERISSGEFARDWLAEAGAGGSKLDMLRETERELEIEKVGKRVRKLFPCQER